MPLAGLLRPTQSGQPQAFPQLPGEPLVMSDIPSESLRAGIRRSPQHRENTSEVGGGDWHNGEMLGLAGN